jgi:tRNA acetyltransferase TAN1
MSQECGNYLRMFSSDVAVCFMVTKPPIDPVRLVHEICLDTAAGNKRTRWAQRFTPIQSTSYANLPDFRTLCEKILGPIFHEDGVGPIKVPPLNCLRLANLKYAIQPHARDNNTMTRDPVIAVVGSVIGKDHIVELKGYDLLVLVETVKVLPTLNVADLEHHRHECREGF